MCICVRVRVYFCVYGLGSVVTVIAEVMELMVPSTVKEMNLIVLMVIMMVLVTNKLW